jgi:hypothetical protein
VKLDADDVDAIAQRVTQLLREPAATPAARYVDAAHIARVLGVDREWVYAHAHQLDAIRLGGPAGRLRFDLQHIERRLLDGPSTANKRPASPASRTRRRAAQSRLDLLPYES